MAAVRSPAVLAGPPAAVSGFVPFTNDADDVVEVTEVLIRDADGGTATVPADPVEVAPGRTARIGVQLSFEPHTPPGRYPLSVEIAGVPVEADAHVVEHHDVRLTPEAIVVEVPAAKEQDAEVGSSTRAADVGVEDGSVVRTVVIANLGNLPVRMPDVGSLALHREDAAFTTVAGLARTTALGEPLDVEELPDPDGVIALRTTGGPVVVPPGGSTAVELRLGGVSPLEPARRYLGMVPVGLRTLVIVVLPAGDPDRPPPRVDPEPPPRPKPAPRKRAVGKGMAGGVAAAKKAAAKKATATKASGGAARQQ